MQEEFDYKNYNWLYYVIGLVMGSIAGYAVEGHILIGAILGFLTGGLFQFLINKSRESEA